MCPLAYSYQVVATDVCGNTYTSYSDTTISTPRNFLEGQIVNVIRSTVVDNEKVLTEWSPPLIHPEMITGYSIYRSTDNENFAYLTSVPQLQNDYMDHQVDVQNNRYYYKILVENTCNLSEGISGITSTIILKANIDEARIVHLDWTPYEGWDSGVEYYILEKKDAEGHWQFLRQVDGSTLEYEYGGE